MKRLLVALVSAGGMIHAAAQPAVQSPLTVRIQGVGKVSPNLGGKSLTVGKSYSIQAVPQGGEVFAAWSGSVTSTANPLTFVMQTNLVLQANFTTNPFPPVAGVYEGLFTNPTNAAVENSGFLKVVVGYSGGFSATVMQGGRQTAFSGQFLVAGSASTVVQRSPSPNLTVLLQLDFSGTNSLTGTVGTGQWVSSLTAWRGGLFRANSQAAYTLIVPGAADPALAPGGAGFATLTVDTAGNGTLSGTLADNTPVTASGQVSPAAAWPFYASLYGGKGTVLGWLCLTNGTGNGLNGTCTWIKKPQPTAYYPAGFTNRVQVTGSRYVVTNNSHILELTNGLLYLGGGSPTNATTNAVKVAGSAITSTNRSLKLSFASRTGQFSGGVANPAVPPAPKSFSLKGTVLQNQNVAVGFFLSGGQSRLVGVGAGPGNVLQGGDSSFNPYSYQASTAPGDPLILRATGIDGTVISYFGPKTAKGAALVVDSFLVQDPTGGATSIAFDAQGRPSIATAPNGVVFNYVWLSSTVVEISAFTPDGAGVTVTNDLATPNPKAPGPGPGSRGAWPTPSDLPGRTGAQPALAPVPFPRPEPDEQTLTTITVTSCGQPVPAAQAQVWLNIFFPDSLTPFTRPAIPAGNGQWTAYVGGPRGSADLGAICSSIAGVLEGGCSALAEVSRGGDVLPCALLENAATEATNPAAGAAMMAACEAATSALRLYCAPLGQAIPGGPDLAEHLCELLRPADVWIENTPINYVPVTRIQGSPGGPIAGNFASTATGPRPQGFTLAGDCCHLAIQTNGAGTVTTVPPGAAYPAGTLVTLTAAPASGSTFAGWSGSASGTNATTQITMNGDQSVGAFFPADPWLGAWSGSYSLARVNQGCSWVDAGSFAMTVSGASPAFSATISIEGVQCRNLADCSLVDISSASGTVIGTVTATTVSASGWITSATGPCGGQPLPIAFSGTLTNGNLSATLITPGNGVVTLTHR